LKTPNKGRKKKKEDIHYYAYSLPIFLSAKDAMNMAALEIL